MHSLTNLFCIHDLNLNGWRVIMWARSLTHACILRTDGHRQWQYPDGKTDLGKIILIQRQPWKLISGQCRQWPTIMMSVQPNIPLVWNGRHFSILKSGTYPIIFIGRAHVPTNYANPVDGFATICYQVRCLRWGHPSLFYTATSLLIWYKMFCMTDISYRLIWMKFVNRLS